MLKSLEQVYRDENKRIGVGEKVSGSPQKLILSEKGQRMVVPGYDEDVIFQNIKQKKTLDINRVTSSNWNWERQHNFVVKYVDRTEPGVASFDRKPKEIRNA